MKQEEESKIRSHFHPPPSTHDLLVTTRDIVIHTQNRQGVNPVLNVDTKKTSPDISLCMVRHYDTIPKRLPSHMQILFSILLPILIIVDASSCKSTVHPSELTSDDK